MNNLINITVKDPVYKHYENEIIKFAEKMIHHQQVRYLEIPQLRIGATDSYFIHYSFTPLIRSQENPDQILELFRKVFMNYTESEDFKKIHPITRLNEELSKVHSIYLIKHLINEISKDEKLKNFIRQLRRQQQRSGGQTPVAVPAPIPASIKQKLQNAIKTAIQKANESTKNYKELKDLVGGKEAGKEPGTFEKLLNLVEQLPQTILDVVLELYGRIEETLPRFSRILKERSKHGSEIYGYRTTKKPTEAIARELALPDELFYAKLVSNGLLAREKVNVKEGSMYVLIDKSGSMGGQKKVWARAVALALFKLAQQKKRKYYLRFFDTKVYPEKPLEKPIEIIEHIARVISSGGTSIDTAIRTAINDIAMNKLSEKVNTIVLITDGEDEVTVTEDELKKHNIELISVMIQGNNETLKKISKQYLKARLDYQGGKQVLKVVEG